MECDQLLVPTIVVGRGTESSNFQIFHLTTKLCQKLSLLFKKYLKFPQKCPNFPPDLKLEVALIVGGRTGGGEERQKDCQTLQQLEENFNTSMQGMYNVGVLYVFMAVIKCYVRGCYEYVAGWWSSSKRF